MHICGLCEWVYLPTIYVCAYVEIRGLCQAASSVVLRALPSQICTATPSLCGDTGDLNSGVHADSKDFNHWVIFSVPHSSVNIEKFDSNACINSHWTSTLLSNLLLWGLSIPNRNKQPDRMCVRRYLGPNTDASSVYQEADMGEEWGCFFK